MKRLKDTIGICKIYWESEFQEWSVVVVGNPAATYYTDDKQDAWDTAKLLNNLGK